MAHLQPSSTAQAGVPPRQIRLTSIRGFMPDTVQLSGQQVREIWEGRFRQKGTGHPYWLYTHIPFCPQICSFCQCSTSLRKSDQQIEAYLRWLDGEMDFLAEASDSGLVKFQYIGGGTPNILSEAQLEWLLGTLNRRFHFDTASRRTYEFLPSALRPDTLPLVRSLGFNRLSCGIQSLSPETLKDVNRSNAGLEELGRTIQHAYDLGYDEVNVDLIHGIGDERTGRFLPGLLELLSLGPTTVTIHNVIPTPANPVFTSVEQELAAHSAFEALEETLGEAVSARFPHMEWVLRPNSWILVDTRFRQKPDFSLWYYSDNERIHIDMLGLGRFAHSNVLGQVCYENLSQAKRYDPREPSYRAFLKTPAVDAALDLVTDLVGDRRSDIELIEKRHGVDALRPLRPALERLRRAGLLVERDGAWRPVHTDGVFIDSFWPVLEAAVPAPAAPAAAPVNKATENGIRIGAGERSLLVFVEKAEPRKRYFGRLGSLGIYYRLAHHEPAADQEPWIGDLMEGFLVDARQLLGSAPTLSVRRATAVLRQHAARVYAAAEGQHTN